MLHCARRFNRNPRKILLATLAIIATTILSVNTSNAVPLNYAIEFDDFLIPGAVNWTGSYTVESNTGLLTRFEAIICRAADPLNECVFSNLFNVSLPAVDDPDDNDNVETDVLTTTNSAVLSLRDGLTNEWQIADPFGSLTRGIYTTRRVPEPESLSLCFLAMLLLSFIQRRSIRRRLTVERPGHGRFKVRLPNPMAGRH